MASFSQWCRQAEQGNLKRVTWVCGRVPLREEVIDGVRRLGKFEEVVHRYAEDDSESSIWDAANQYPFDPAARRLVQVRGAEQIQNWTPLADWMNNSRKLPNTYLLFVADEATFRHEELPDGKQTLADPLSFLQNRASLVECRMPNEADFAAWIRWRTGTDAHTGRRLIQRCGGDVARVRNVVQLAAPLGVPLTPALVDLLAEAAAPPDFVRNLAVLDKRAALGSLPEGQEAVRALGQLNSLLDVMTELHPLLQRAAPMREIAEEKKVPVHLARQLLEHAKHYDPGAVRRRRNVLTEVDEVAQVGGPQTGLLEGLVALW